MTPDQSRLEQLRKEYDALLLAVGRVRAACAELPGPPLGPLTKYGQGFQDGYDDALHVILRALDGDGDE